MRGWPRANHSTMNLRTFLDLLDSEQRKQFASLALTKPSHLWQLKGGHSRAGLRLMWRMVLASRKMFPRKSARWLTLDELHLEAEQLRAARLAQRAEA